MRPIIKGALIAALSLGLAGPSLGILDPAAAEAAPPEAQRSTKKTTQRKLRRPVRGGKPTKQRKTRSDRKRMSVRGSAQDRSKGDRRGRRAGSEPIARYFVTALPKVGQPQITITALETGPMKIFLRRVDQTGFHTEKTFNATKGQSMTISVPENTHNDQCIGINHQYELSVMKGIERPANKVTTSDKPSGQVKLCVSRSGAFFDPAKAYGGTTPGNFGHCARPGADPWPDPDPERCR